jgi:uncharacterized protein with HEPN domain
MSTITKNEDTKAYDIDVPLDWSDLMLIKGALLHYYKGNDTVRTQTRIDNKLTELNNELNEKLINRLED